MDPVGDPQQAAVYRAQSRVAGRLPDGDLADLASFRTYVDSLLRAEGLELAGCFRAWWFSGAQPGVVVNWAGRDWSPVGLDVELPEVGIVVPFDPPVRWSAFDFENDAILVSGPSGQPLSHQLLAVHEVAHKSCPLPEPHGSAWVREFVRLAEKHLGEAIAAELTAELTAEDVQAA